MSSWWLDDGHKRQEEAPYTFYKPSSEAIAKLEPGQIVKLIFCNDPNEQDIPNVERMWVIIEINDNGLFKGKLDNEPRYIKDLKYEDTVVFEEKHIIAIHDEPTDTNHERFFKRCYVSNKVLNDKEKSGFIYKEEPDEENDSGWRIMKGDETDEELDDSSNFSYVAIGCILNDDDSFVDLLDAPIGSSYEWDEESQSWDQVK